MIPVKDLTDLCFDINECSDEPCNDLEYCMNMIGSYECQCLEGYKYNEVKQCEDINECEEDLLACGSNNICKNNLGQNLNRIFRHEFLWPRVSGVGPWMSPWLPPWVSVAL